MTQDKTNKVSNVPPLRFPEFSGEWEKFALSDFTERVTRRNKRNACRLPLTISAQYGLVDQITFFNKQIASADMSNYYLMKKGEFTYNKSYSGDYPWGAVKRLDRYDEGCLSSLYICFSLKPFVNSDFITHYFETTKWYRGVSEIAGEGARNHGLLNIAIPDYFATKHYLPASSEEQQKIADLFNLLTKRIETQIRVIEDLQTLKKALRKQIFSELLLDKEPNLQIKDVLEYEQPTKYLVSNTEYSDDVTLIPVLTANKAFILGYTDDINGIYSKGKCIILDDFTLDCKLVDFPFKVKSSAIKILTAKRGANIRYLYEYLKFLDLGTSEHKRHYIAEIEPLEIVMPDINIANNIANALELMDKRIYLAENMLIQYRQQKQFLLQQMFI